MCTFVRVHVVTVSDTDVTQTGDRPFLIDPRGYSNASFISRVNPRSRLRVSVLPVLDWVQFFVRRNVTSS